MFRDTQLSERVSIPTSALVCPSKNQLNLILQAFVQRKRLYKYHERLHGMITKVQVNCFHPTQPCAHASHVWSTPADCHYVHVLCTYQCTVLNAKPGDRLPSKVKSIDSRGLVCTVGDSELDVIVYKNDKNQSTSEPEPRSIPDALWRPGAFTVLVFEGISPTDGPYASIAPESIQNIPFSDAPSLLLTNDPEPESIFELDTSSSSTSHSNLTPKPRVRKNKKVSE